MPIVLLFIGVVFIVTAIRGTERDLGNLLIADFTGAGNFFYWIGALIAIGAIGYIPGLKGPSRLFMALIFVALLFSNKGFFANLKAQLAAAASPKGVQAAQTEAQTDAQADTASSSSSSSSSSGSGSSGILGTGISVGQVAQIAAIAAL